MKMKNLSNLILIGTISFCTITCNQKNKKEKILNIKSPNESISINFQLQNGIPFYQVDFKNKSIIDTSRLGFEFANIPSLKDNFEIDSSYIRSFSETWKPKTGQFSTIKNEYNELIIRLKEKSTAARTLILYFRVFDEGLAIRYEIPAQKGVDSILVSDELTQFNLLGNHKAWWNEAHYDSYEIMYNTTPLSDVKSLIQNFNTKSEAANELYMKNIAHTLAFNTPLTMVTSDSVYISFHEANLTKYPEMTLALEDAKPFRLKSDLVPWPDGIKVRAKTNLISPWRTVHITKNPADFMTSYLEENLNEPSKIDDESFITPIKYMGVWWGYHIGKFTWDPRGARGIADGLDDWMIKKPHGASTENTKKYIDFASKNKIPFLLIEGWNPTNYAIDSVDNFQKSHKDFDLKKVVDYGKSKNVEIVIHNESMGQAKNLELQMDSAFSRYNKLGIRAMKVGWAWHLETKNFNRNWKGRNDTSKYIGGKYFQHSQWAVEHYRRVLECAAKNKQMVALHEYIKETGIRRTYPNLMALEGVRGNEYNPWNKGKGNLPEHVTIIPFTRQLAGPIDYTPGIFDVLFDKYKGPQRVNNTLANQLALYVVFWSPMQMAADLPENYENHPAFEFIKNVPTTWDTTLVLNASIGDYTTVVRKNGKNWYLGSVTDENKRSLNIKLDFLNANKSYQMIIYRDADDADWKTNPVAYTIEKKMVKKGDNYILNLAAGGGQAIEIIEK
ncbi:MAG: glycoside hydrolase family 97 protein [Cytophagales bacterium]|nr:MAG: glycoside hydrolase family 97 protein [Cytophagales bacterium]